MSRVWAGLGTSSALETAEALLGVAGRWPSWGATLFPVRLRWRSEAPAWLAVAADGLKVLAASPDMVPIFIIISFIFISPSDWCW